MRKKEFNFHIQSWLDARLDNLKHHAKSSLRKYRILAVLVVLVNLASIATIFAGMILLFKRTPNSRPVYNAMVILAAVVITLISLLSGINILYKQRMSNIIYDEARQGVMVEYAKYKEGIGRYSVPETKDKELVDMLLAIELDTNQKVENRRNKAWILRYNTRIDRAKLLEATKGAEKNENN